MAATGRECRHLAASLDPSLILLDGQVSDENPCHLIDFLKRGAIRRPVPVAVLSGDESQRVAFIRAGAVSLITKPLRIADVERSLMTLLDVFSTR